MTTDELQKLLTGPEWVLPLMQDIAANKISRDQVNAIFDYMDEQKFKERLAALILESEHSK